MASPADADTASFFFWNKHKPILLFCHIVGVWNCRTNHVARSVPRDQHSYSHVSHLYACSVSQRNILFPRKHFMFLGKHNKSGPWMEPWGIPVWYFTFNWCAIIKQYIAYGCLSVWQVITFLRMCSEASFEEVGGRRPQGKRKKEKRKKKKEKLKKERKRRKKKNENYK